MVLRRGCTGKPNSHGCSYPFHLWWILIHVKKHVSETGHLAGLSPGRMSPGFFFHLLCIQIHCSGYFLIMSS